MANKFKGEVEFKVDGKNWTLRFSTNAIAELEALADCSYSQFLSKFSDLSNIGFKNTRLMLYAGLKENHPAVTVESCGDLVDAMGYIDALNKVSEAFYLAYEHHYKEVEQVGEQKKSKK